MEVDGNEGVANGRIALWCMPNEIKRAVGGHPNDRAVDETMVATLRRMRSAVRQRAYDKGDPTRWKATGAEVPGDEGLRGTLAECGKAGTMRKVYLDEAMAKAIASGQPRFARDLAASVALTGRREVERRERARQRRMAPSGEAGATA